MTVLHYLEETSKRYGDKTAIVDHAGTLSFNTLRENALKVAGYISNHLNGKRNAPIFVYLPKSKKTIVCFLGIAYSGNLYSLTDVKFPYEKADRIINLLSPALIITDNKNGDKLRENGVSKEKIVLYDDIIASGCAFNPEPELTKIIDRDPLYVLFTSGSTGTPKGVTIAHGSVRDYIDFLVKKFDLNKSLKILNQAPFYFDNSVLDIYVTLAVGAELHIVSETYYTYAAKLTHYISDKGINFIFWVPSAIIHVANSGTLASLSDSCLNDVFFCGEVMSNKQLNQWRRTLPQARFVNLYGPTEITDACTYFEVSRSFGDDEPLPLGYPCDNTDIMLLDEGNMRIVEPNIQGELCVRGSSLSLGYWKNPVETTQRFIQNPLHNNYEEKIYKTGDLAHYNKRGEIMFDGRKDFQIKHMGHRIELGEIESAASSVSGVTHVCALYNQEIILVYVGETDCDTVHKALAAKLPRYMVPGLYQKIDKMPLNDNGKIDRKSLGTL
ncbi:MAG: amino acid adenylation domain-containing protein [Oscillospiraceae bacterium]|nr:amino acid adenylation domain-containing protein [Oscillospiraceae bacterium]